MMFREIAMLDNKTTKQIVPDMSEFDVEDVISIFMGGEPVSDVQIEYEDESSEEESED